MDLKIIPIVQVIISALLMLLASAFNSSFDYFLPTKNIIVSVLSVFAVFIGVLAIYSFKKHQTTVNPTCPEKTNNVVDNGIYAYSRNPMYLAMLIILIALAVYLSNLSCFLVIPLFVVYITQFQIKPEERVLTSLFGQGYLTYTAKVRRWF